MYKYIVDLTQKFKGLILVRTIKAYVANNSPINNAFILSRHCTV